MLDTVLVVLARRLREPDRHHLRGIVPFIDRRRDIEAFIALQSNQLSAERGSEHFRDFRLADARLALEQEGPTEAQAQEDDGRQRALRDIGGAAQQRERFVDRSGRRDVAGVVCVLGMWILERKRPPDRPKGAKIK